MDLARKSLPLGTRPALILVDLIHAFTDPSCPLGSAADDIVRANQRLLHAFREKNLPIFFTTVVYEHDEQAKVFRKRINALNILKKNSSWVDIDERLKPRKNEYIIEKQWASAFFKTDLEERLKHEKVDSLIVTGLTTSGCVRASVVDALQHDYVTYVPKEAVGDRNLDAHDANLFDMHAKYAEVTSVDKVLTQLEQSEILVAQV